MCLSVATENIFRMQKPYCKTRYGLILLLRKNYRWQIKQLPTQVLKFIKYSLRFYKFIKCLSDPKKHKHIK